MAPKTVSLPHEPGFAEATQVFNLAAVPEPAAALTAHTIDDIRAALRYAEATGAPVRILATGHTAGAQRPMAGAVLVKTALRGEVEIDAAARVARVPAGTRWGAVVEAAAPHGLTAPHGSSPTVGVVGYSLGGGMSAYGRRFGLAANSVRAIELVTADGELRRVDAGTDAELFRALRGGGGGFGVVTAIEIALFPASSVHTGAAFWPAKHAAELLAAWRAWTLTAPDEVTTSLRVLNLPPLPDVPPVLAGGPVLCLDGAVLSTDDDHEATARRHTAELLDPLRAIAEPVMDTWHRAEPAAVLAAHMDPTDPVPVVGEHMLLGELDDGGEAAFLRVLGEGSGSPLVAAGLRQLGGAYSRPDPAGGVLNHLDARFSYAGSGVPMGPVTVEALRKHAAVVRAALSKWDTGRTVPSFVEHVEQPQGHLSPEQIAEVDAVRERVDPAGRFRGDIAPNATALG
ncbi:FAD-dependent oxidoreductase [Amycolatopsis sp. NBC_01286]|uniref:FAD-dependent oxidoreductase n=1 Tax=Amycolatopsis sp. NBC_01286 TaxID=2903560 RepID=UPI002E110D81|nr:FAD-dependent oxidoreductase [Amycolatopsis sp. NBC_01286]